MDNPLFEFKETDKNLKDTYILIKCEKDRFRLSWIYYGGVLQGLRKTIYIKQGHEGYLTIKRMFKSLKKGIISG